MTAKELLQKLAEKEITPLSICNENFIQLVLPELYQVLRKDMKALGYSDATSAQRSRLYNQSQEIYKEAKKVFLEEIGEIEEVDHWGGEGEGDDYGYVWYFPLHDVYLRADGYYQSYEGSDMSSARFYEVKPQQKTITVYERV